MSYKIPDSTRIGHVHLKVSDHVFNEHGVPSASY